MRALVYIYIFQYTYCGKRPGHGSHSPSKRMTWLFQPSHTSLSQSQSYFLFFFFSIQHLFKAKKKKEEEKRQEHTHRHTHRVPCSLDGAPAHTVWLGDRVQVSFFALRIFLFFFSLEEKGLLRRNQKLLFPSSE